MIEEQAQVIRTEGEFAWVRTQRKSTCGQCAAQKGCGTNVFSKVLGNKLVEFKAINKIDAVAGDQVILGLHESVLLKSAALMYVLPLVLMFVFALLATAVGHSLAGDISQAWVSLFAVLGLLLGFFGARLFARAHQTDESFQPVILRRTTLPEQYSINHLQKV
jgi:sigma-E factor negative regulatory protein RseC